jgi:hypothetical protein
LVEDREVVEQVQPPLMVITVDPLVAEVLALVYPEPLLVVKVILVVLA